MLLADQDRTLWDRALIAEGIALVERAISSRRFGPYTLQAAIAAVHAEAATADATDWDQIVGLYDVLARADPSPVIELNRAAAIAMRDGPAAGLAIIDAILARGDLDGYHLAHSARADLCRRLGRTGRCTRGVSARAGVSASRAGEKIFGEEVEGVIKKRSRVARGRRATASAFSGVRRMMMRPMISMMTPFKAEARIPSICITSLPFAAEYHQFLRQP